MANLRSHPRFSFIDCREAPYSNEKKELFLPAATRDNARVNDAQLKPRHVNATAIEGNGYLEKRERRLKASG